MATLRHKAEVFFFVVFPDYEWNEDIVVTDDSHFHAHVVLFDYVHAFTEQLFQSVLAVRLGKIGAISNVIRVFRIYLFVFWINGGRRIKKTFTFFFEQVLSISRLSLASARTGIQNVL